MIRIIKNLLWIPLVFIFAGCAMTLEYGRWPEPTQLDKLQLGQSDSTEILQLLGEPTGKGMGRMPDFPDTATVWSYEYQRVSGATTSEVEINLLLIFLKDGVYQGHFWFEADDEMQMSGAAR